MENILQHHGVKGMKWGVRRFQPYSNGLFRRGPKSKEVGKLEIIRDRKKHSYKSEKNLTRKNSKRMEYTHAKQDLRNQKIIEKLNSRPKSSSQLKAEEKYLKKGYNDREAQIEAYKYIQTKKIVAAAAITTIAVAGAMVAKKEYNDRVDRIIKSGTTMQRLTANAEEGVSDAFYTSFVKSDNTRYKGLFGMADGSNTKHIKKMTSMKDIKQASPKMARDTFTELYKGDPEFKKMVNERYGKDLPSFGAVGDVMKKAKQSLNSGKIDKNVYEAFNIGLVLQDEQSNAMKKKFYDTMVGKGYNAIRDVNDTKKSIGFGAKNPAIVFNASDSISIDSVRKLKDSEVKKSLTKVLVKDASMDVMSQGAIFTGGGLGIALTDKAVTRTSGNRYIENYRKEHPNSKLTNTEIRRQYEKNLVGGKR